MAAPAHVQQWIQSGAGPLNVSLTGVTAGNTLALIMFQPLSAVRTYSASDDVDGAWSAGPLADLGGSRYSQIFYLIGSSGGSKSVTVTPSAGTNDISVSVVEIGPSTASVSSNFVDTGTSTSHPCAAVGALDTPADSYILSGAVLQASGGTYTANANCTLLQQGDASHGYLAQYRRSDAALTDERSTWTSGTARNTGGVSMAFVSAASSTPTVTTSAVSSADQTSINCGGNVTDGGSSAVTARGVCWNTTGSPTTVDSTTSDGTGVGAYSSAITGLSVGTVYYIRAYATNTQGTSYGNEITVTTGQERWAVASGSWSATGTWNGGTLPALYDDVYANGNTVTLDVTPSVNTLRRTAGGTAVAGGSFVPGGSASFSPIGSGLVY